MTTWFLLALIVVMLPGAVLQTIDLYNHFKPEPLTDFLHEIHAAPAIPVPPGATPNTETLLAEAIPFMQSVMARLKADPLGDRAHTFRAVLAGVLANPHIELATEKDINVAVSLAKTIASEVLLSSTIPGDEDSETVAAAVAAAATGPAVEVSEKA